MMAAWEVDKLPNETKAAVAKVKTVLVRFRVFIAFPFARDVLDKNRLLDSLTRLWICFVMVFSLKKDVLDKDRLFDLLLKLLDHVLMVV